MKQDSLTLETVRTLTTNSLFLKVALIKSLIREWSQPEQIEALRVTLMELSNPKPQSVKERNAEFIRKLDGL